MSLKSVAMLILVGVSLVAGQRSPYAGSRPANGYKDRFATTNTAGAASAASATATGTTQTNGNAVPNLGDRIGESGTGASTTAGPTTTTQRLPYDALGDAFAVHQAMLKPQDHQPFWVINQAHIEAHRGGAARPPQAVRPAITGEGVVNRFGESDGFVNAGGFDPNSINTISQPEIVYPINMQAPVRGQGSPQIGSTQIVPVQNNVPAQQSTQLPLDQQQIVQQMLLQQQSVQQQAITQQQNTQRPRPISQQPNFQQPSPQQPIGQQPIQSQPFPQQPIRPQPQPIQQANVPSFNNEQQFQPSDNFYHVAPYFTEYDY